MNQILHIVKESVKTTQDHANLSRHSHPLTIGQNIYCVHLLTLRHCLWPSVLSERHDILAPFNFLNGLDHLALPHNVVIPLIFHVIHLKPFLWSRDNAMIVKDLVT